ncbi:alpha/beta fold hydrolase [Streptomyces sp. NPDC017673]|uniref:alpha/beta fold hydrolase n=1 Tax=unclassified Streptomyces TaxID=2593676 RepID=UPI0037902273
MAEFDHNMFEHEGVRIHYVTAGEPPSEDGDDKTIVLIHGWPQTWWEWRHIMEPLHSDGWFVVSPDVRGAGGSSKPEGGYDKQTIAGDIRALLPRPRDAGRLRLRHSLAGRGRAPHGLGSPYPGHRGTRKRCGDDELR